MSRTWQAKSDWNLSAVFVNAFGLKLKKSFPWIAVNGNGCVNLDGCPTSQLRHRLLLAPYGPAQSQKRWPWVEGSAPDTTSRRICYSSTNCSFLCRVEDRGGINPPELCPFFSQPAALGIVLSPSRGCYWGVQPLCGAWCPARHRLQPSIKCSVPTFAGTGGWYLFKGISFSFHIFTSFFFKNRKITKCFIFLSPPCFL